MLEKIDHIRIDPQRDLLFGWRHGNGLFPDGIRDGGASL